MFLFPKFTAGRSHTANFFFFVQMLVHSFLFLNMKYVAFNRL